MNKKFVHLIYIPFVGVGIGLRGDDWYRERIDIFKNYTLRSLLQQENRNFILWLSFTEKERTNPLTKELSLYLRSVRMPYILTFDGLMYWDDKFGGGLKHKLLNCSRVVRRSLRNKELSFLLPSIYEVLFKDKNSTLESRLDKSLITFHNRFDDVDLVYLTRIDSDDLFHKSVVKEIQNYPIEFKTPKYYFNALVFDRGYIYNTSTNELAYYNPLTNPPFHTLLFPASIFFSAKEHIAFYNGYKSHEDVTRVFTYKQLPDYRYCVVHHNPKNHISNSWSHPFIGKLVEDKNILKEFGL